MTRFERPDLLDVYARVSRIGDDRQRPVEGQVKDCVALVRARGAEVGEVHDKDRGRSAWNPRVKRPSWDRLMERLESAERVTGGVIVWDLARFSRRPIEGERLITAAERGLLVLDSEGEYDLTSASGKKAFRDQMSTAAYESDRLSSRVKRGKKLAAVRGESPVSTRPFGFEPDAVTIREAEAAVIRDLVERLLAGESQNDMIRDLNERGITTSTGGQWGRTGLRDVLTRPRNAGLVEHLGEIVGRLQNAAGEPCQPIVPEETYQRVSALFASRRPGRPPSAAYLCSGVVACGACGHGLTGHLRPATGSRPDGEPRRFYRCQPRAHDGGCGRIRVDQLELDGHIRRLVVKILGNPQHAAAVEAAARAARDAQERLDAELSECDQLIAFLDGRLARREITQERYGRMVAPIEAQAAELRARVDALRVEEPGEASADEVAASREEWDQRWDEAVAAERRRMIRRALRGRRLLVMPADPAGPRAFDPDRIVIDPPDALLGPARTGR